MMSQTLSKDTYTYTAFNNINISHDIQHYYTYVRSNDIRHLQIGAIPMPSDNDKEKKDKLKDGKQFGDWWAFIKATLMDEER